MELRAVIGQGVRHAREAAGLRQDDLARHARTRWGLKWSQSKIAALERGEKSINGEELMILPLLLSAACKRPVSLAELLDTDARVELTPTFRAPARSLLDFLCREPPVHIELRDSGTASDNLSVSAEAALLGFAALAVTAQTTQERLEELALPLSEAARWRTMSGEVEHLVAKRIGEPVEVVAGLAERLWQRSLLKERDARIDQTASQRRQQALRGRATKELIAELGAEIRRRERELSGER